MYAKQLSPNAKGSFDRIIPDLCAERLSQCDYHVQLPIHSATRCRVCLSLLINTEHGCCPVAARSPRLTR